MYWTPLYWTPRSQFYFVLGQSYYRLSLIILFCCVLSVYKIRRKWLNHFASPSMSLHIYHPGLHYCLSSALLLSSLLTEASCLEYNCPHWQKGQTFRWIPVSGVSSRGFCRRLKEMAKVRSGRIDSRNYYLLVRSRCSSWIRILFLVKGIIIKS